MSVYFVRYENLIKIGYSSHLASRIQTIISGAPGHVEFLGYTPGERDFERHLHGVFESDRFSGEWFIASVRLLGLIELLAIKEMPSQDGAGNKITRAVLDEQWLDMSKRVRKAAAHRWPELDHRHRKDELTRLLEWHPRRTRALYEAAPGMTLKQLEAECLDERLFQGMSPTPLQPTTEDKENG